MSFLKLADWTMCLRFAFVVGAIGLLDSSTAQAQTNYTTFLSRATGQNVAGCGNHDSPCFNFSYGLTQTRAGGQIICKDAAHLDFTTITKSITVICDQAPISNSFTGGVYALNINIATADVVTLVGLNFNGGENPGYGSLPAIDFNGSGTLVLEKVNVTNWYYTGLLFRPNGPGRLVVSDSLFAKNGNGTSGAGIRVFPPPSGSARVSVTRSRFSANTFGFAIDGTGGTAGINAQITDSVVAGNAQDGVIAVTSGAPIGLLMDRSQSHDNIFYGARVVGAAATLRLVGSSVVGNGIGVASQSGGNLLSGGGNVVEANGTDGTFTGSFSIK